MQTHTPFKSATSLTRIASFLADLFYIQLIARFWLYPLIQPQDWDILRSDQFFTTNLLGFGFIVVALLVKDGWWGRSFGRWLFLSYVARVEDNFPPARFGQTLKRNLSYFLVPLIVWQLLFKAYGRHLGDLWAGTVVVKSLSGLSIRKVTLRCLAILLFFSLLWLGYNLCQVRQIEKSSLYRIATAELQDKDQVRFFKELFWQDDSLVLVLKTQDRKITSTFFYQDGLYKMRSQTQAPIGPDAKETFEKDATNSR